jgi:hypothetical protein
LHCEHTLWSPATKKNLQNTVVLVWSRPAPCVCREIVRVTPAARVTAIGVPVGRA